MKNYFYIIQRNGMIMEIENIGDRFVSSLEQWQKGGLIIFPTLGAGINAVDISNIFNQEQYQNYVDSVQPKLYIKNGAWYDMKDRTKPIRYEKWRQLELDSKKVEQIEEPRKSGVEIKRLFDKYRPEFMKNSDIKNNK